MGERDRGIREREIGGWLVKGTALLLEYDVFFGFFFHVSCFVFENYWYEWAF